MQLAGKAALISGAGGDICRAIAIAFAREGASVVCCDIVSADRAAETVRMINDIGGQGDLATLRRRQRGANPGAAAAAGSCSRSAASTSSSMAPP